MVSKLRRDRVYKVEVQKRCNRCDAIITEGERELPSVIEDYLCDGCRPEIVVEHVATLMCMCPHCGGFSGIEMYESMDPDGGAIICSVCKEEIPPNLVDSLCRWVEE